MGSSGCVTVRFLFCLISASARSCCCVPAVKLSSSTATTTWQRHPPEPQSAGCCWRQRAKRQRAKRQHAKRQRAKRQRARRQGRDLEDGPVEDDDKGELEEDDRPVELPFVVKGRQVLRPPLVEGHEDEEREHRACKRPEVVLPPHASPSVPRNFVTHNMPHTDRSTRAVGCDADDREYEGDKKPNGERVEHRHECLDNARCDSAQFLVPPDDA
eukprot:1658532-Rhodomonas_salina.2